MAKFVALKRSKSEHDLSEFETSSTDKTSHGKTPSGICMVNYDIYN